MSNKKQPLAARIAPQEAKRKPAAKASTGIEAFMINMLAHPDIKEATLIIAEQAEHENDIKNGYEIETLNRTLSSLDDDYKTSDKAVKARKKTLDDTEPFVPTPADGDGGQYKKVFWDWEFKDKTMMLVTTLALIAAMCMGAANVYANLIASGEGIFLTKPYLAIAISLLLPIAAIAVKNLSHYIHNPLYRRWYGLGIYGVTLASLVVWSVLFAQSFSGISGGFDVNALLEESSSNSGSALVWSQLMLELLMGSALFLTIEEIANKYAPESFLPNIAHIKAKKAYEAALAAHKKIEENYAGKHGRLVTLYAENQKYTNEKVAEFVAMKSRRAAQFN